MSDLGWCIVFFILVLMFLGSELSLYENARLLLKCIEEQKGITHIADQFK